MFSAGRVSRPSENILRLGVETEAGHRGVNAAVCCQNSPGGRCAALSGDGGAGGHVTKTVRSAAAARRDDAAGSAIWHQSSVVAALRGSPCNPSASAPCACALWRLRLKPAVQKLLHNGSVCPRLRPLNLQVPLHGSALRGLPVLRVYMSV